MNYLAKCVFEFVVDSGHLRCAVSVPVSLFLSLSLCGQEQDQGLRQGPSSLCLIAGILFFVSVRALRRRVGSFALGFLCQSFLWPPVAIAGGALWPPVAHLTSPTNPQHHAPCQ